MPGIIFRQRLQEATGSTWEEWAARLDGRADKLWSHERLKAYLIEEYALSEEWAEWLAVMYGELIGRVPVGTTKDAGVQIGVRRTLNAPPDKVWRFLISPEGLKLWIGDTPAFELREGAEYESRDGVTGKVTVVDPGRKLRLTWKRPEWLTASRLQLYVMGASAGRTTVSIHQEMLEDVYMRGIMKHHWEEVLAGLRSKLEAAGE